MARVTARIHIDEAALERESGAHLRRFHRSLTRRIANQARADVPVRTGNLGRSIGELPQRYRPFHVDGGVEATADYAAPVHEGSRPHVIRARRAEALHFWWHGREMFRKSVFHPGVRARPFLRNAGERVAATDPRIRIR
ncbi:tail assembly chaperone [Mycobacterium phage Saguaro]|uniref:Tail assembly chaperone n=1 Tax=Mycobacterium phage Saguaro TaxID=2315616 RepID=A0A386K9F2_9CAUD|nr:tail assembly chaperone [Mycobacterium phage Saguaro]AYD82021.1 tail assembly chaperone [Mycobacterium phage Saguaro]